MRKRKLLTDFLRFFDFDYCVYDNGLIGLIDLLGGNLGSITNERFSNNENVLHVLLIDWKLIMMTTCLMM